MILTSHNLRQDNFYLFKKNDMSRNLGSSSQPPSDLNIWLCVLRI